MTGPGGRLGGALLVATLALTGCIAMPDQGPVVTSEEDGASGPDAPADIVPEPPRPGGSPTDIVLGFINAMAASPISTTVAQEFLTESAADSWRPEQSTIVYTDTSPPSGLSEVEVTLTDAARLDVRGRWQGPLSADRSVLRFPVVLEGDEWRISKAPDALIVPERWFEQRFQPVSLYFFDPDGKVLVPEPVYLPRGDQLATALTRDLLLGPPLGLSRVERTFFPAGMTAGLSTPVSDAGVADIALEGDASQLTPQAIELMLAQLSWTLRQVPGITSLRLSIGREPLDLPGGVKELDIGYGAEFDPTGFLASGAPFALRSGLLVTGPIEAMAAVNGPFGVQDYGLRSFAVDPTSMKVAGVSGSGRSVSVSPLREATGGVEQVASGADNLLPPAWDLSGRLWLVDRRTGGALVSVVVRNRPREVKVPGVTGEVVRTFTVSRDGTRFVAVLVRPDGDEIVVSRVSSGDGGRLRVSRARALPWDAGLPLRAFDLGWRSPTSVAVLYALTDELAQVRTVSLDGSLGGGQIPGTTLRGGQRWLATSPVEAETGYALSRQEVVGLADTSVPFKLPGVQMSTVTYVG